MSRGFTVRPTPLGLQSPAFQLGDSPSETEQIWSKLAPLYWFYPIGELKAGAQVFADGLGKPVICFQYFGAGRVLFHAIDSTWRWRAGGGEPFFARYWVQTIRFLAHGKLGKGRGVELTTDRREYRRGEVAQLRARFLDTQLAPAGEEVVVLVNVAGQAQATNHAPSQSGIAGVYEGSLADLTDGQYEVLMVEPQLPGNPAAVRFSVVAPPGEFARPEMDAAALAAAAETTHGKFYTIADADRLLTDLPAGRRVPIRNLPPIPIWNRWWLLSAFLGCITAEWILRKAERNALRYRFGRAADAKGSSTMHPLSQKIAFLQRQLVWRRRAVAACWIVATAIAAALVLGLIDYLVRSSDPGLRIMATVAFMAAVAWAAYRWWYLPQQQRLRSISRCSTSGSSLPAAP